MSEAATKLPPEETASAEADKPAATPEPVAMEPETAHVAHAPEPVSIERTDADAEPDGEQSQAHASGKADFKQDAIKFMRKGADTLRKGAEEARKGANVLIEKSRKISIQTPSWAAEPFRGPKTFTPRADFSMNSVSYEIAVELPGLEEKAVHVKLSDGQIAVSGEKSKLPEGENNKTYFLQERQFGRFERSFRLPNDVDPAKIEARFERNVLKIVLPKYPEATVPEREIEVKAG